MRLIDGQAVRHGVEPKESVGRRRFGSKLHHPCLVRSNSKRRQPCPLMDEIHQPPVPVHRQILPHLVALPSPQTSGCLLITYEPVPVPVPVPVPITSHGIWGLASGR